MSTRPVTLDMSTAQPLQGQPVQLDMSTAQALDQNDGGAPLPKVTPSTNPKLAVAMSAKDMPEYVGATGAAGAGLMGAAALGDTPIVGPAIKWAAKKIAPIAVPAMASEAIHAAKNLPVVGPVIQHIPFAEMLPWLGGGKGEKEPPAEDPGAPNPETPPTEVRQAGSLYRGVQQYEDPAAGLGEIPVKRGQLADSVQQPQASAPQRGSLRQMVNDVGDQVGKGLGASPPPNPKEPIYQRGNSSSQMQGGDSDLPQGHTAVQSSALKSYRYIPESNEFHAQYGSGNGTVHVFGDVSPEEAQQFEQAKSKGQAMQQIKNGHPLVAKIINGKRQAVTPTQ